MVTRRSVQTCHWGTPTLFLPWPLWYDASQHEWSCLRGGRPRVLRDPSVCRTCAYWAAAERPAALPLPVKPRREAPTSPS